jgi:hypothetical protein
MAQSTKSEPITWEQVLPVHRSQSGISTRDGKVVSLLCNQAKAGPYADEVFEDKIIYRVTTATLRQNVEALKRMVGTPEPVSVFEKLGKNRWVDLGKWQVKQLAAEEDCVLFLLTPFQS